MSDRVFHVISNTHWDREWRFPFQRNRQMLVEMLDEVLHILDAEPDYRAYHLDSQSVMVRDYLEARPHKKEMLKRMVRENRLLIGPWYTLPDEYMVGGENLVRNLLRGHEVCRGYGGASKIGYSPFSWGQISQLPQLYRDFGIDLIMFYRGINSLDSPKAEFIWEGADGTRALSSRFSTWPRYNFYFYIYRPVVHGEQPADIEHKWGEGAAFHFADREQHSEDYFMTRRKNGYTPENLRASVEKIIRDQAGDFTTRHVIWMEGHDSSGPNAKTVQLLRDIRREFPELDVRHSTLEEYARLLAEEVDEDQLPVVTGERRSAQYDNRSANLYGYALSARIYLKQANFDAERWIQHYAEPLNSLMGMAGLDITDRLPELAWEPLILNSAHDSIGGCSLDPIHEDMMNRFKQSGEISRGLFDRATRHLATLIDLRSHEPESIHLVAVNTTQYRRSEVVEAFVDVPRGLDKGGIRLAGPDGGSLPFQMISRKEVQPVLEQPVNRPKYFDMVRYRIYMETPEVPPMGFQTVKVEPVSRVDVAGASSHDAPVDTPVDTPLHTPVETPSGAPVDTTFDAPVDTPANIPGITGQASSGTATPGSGNDPAALTTPIATQKNGKWHLDTDILAVSVNPDGTLDITDKSRGRTFRNQGWLYDEGEAGHAWVHEPIGPFVDTRGTRAETELLENGPLRATLAIRHVLKLSPSLNARKALVAGTPEAASTSTISQNIPADATGSTGFNTINVPVEIRVTMRAGTPWPEFQIDLDNRVESHRLRIMFPLGLDAGHSWGEGQFDVVRRPTRRIDSSDWVEQPMYDYPMHHFVDVANAAEGVAVLVDGLKEYEVLDVAEAGQQAPSGKRESSARPDDLGLSASPKPVQTLAITLLRSFEYRIPLASEVDYSDMKGTQCLGRQSFRLAFYPHEGDWQEGGVFEQAMRFNYGVRLFQSGRTEGDIAPGTSLLDISPGELTFSALKKAEGAFVDEDGRFGSRDRYVLRICNPTEETVEGEVTLRFPVRSAAQVTMEETHVRDLEVKDGHAVPVTLASRQIMSILLEV